jgi:glucose-6-phosphate isomerase
VEADLIKEAVWEDRRQGFRLDLRRMDIPSSFRAEMQDALQRALADMRALEQGAIANPDEGRMVGHYWLRAPELAPTMEIAAEIHATLEKVLAFARDVHVEQQFRHYLLIGIGGSALGPQFVAEALGGPKDRLRPHFMDNTDPDGFARTLRALGDDLARTLTVVISKSGGTPETRNGMLEAASAYRAKKLDFGKHACAVTQEGSALDRTAQEQGFLARFPMWDWVGGRTSELSAVGLLPAALQGIDIEAMLEGAAAMDRATRASDPAMNPAAMLALAWHHATGGRGNRDMVVLPYKDRLALFSRYLQQLVMESLGKERDLDGKVVHQGIAVYGNKGSTDQHAYVQQLREGVPNFFVTFLQVLVDGGGGLEVERGITSGDYLHGFLLGTRRALHEAGRPSILLTLREVSPASVGGLIALYERAVGLYASLIHVNAYHQPGVEAGKKAAASILALQKKVVAALQQRRSGSAEQIARESGVADDVETVEQILEHLAANPGRGVTRREEDGMTTYDAS